MILYYAAGGGLGHLTRARAVVHTLRITAPVTVLTSSPFAADRRVIGDFEVIRIPPELASQPQDYRDWLRALLAARRPAELFLDAFPAGLLGEFCDFPLPPGTRVHHVARLLRWQEYGRRLSGAAPAFARTYLLEPLSSPHEEFLRGRSQQVERLILDDPPHQLTDEVKELAIRIMRPSVVEYTLTDRRQATHRPIWLVVHAGSSEEIAELIGYADDMRRLERVEPRLILLSPGEPSALRQAVAARFAAPEPTDNAQPLLPPAAFEIFDFYPASAFFRMADRIITACGFNAMRQTAVYAPKHRYLPFPRRLDDQFERALFRNRLT